MAEGSGHSDVWRAVRRACPRRGSSLGRCSSRASRAVSGRRVRRAAASGAGAIAAAALALIAIGADATALAGLLALVTAALVLDARRGGALALAAASALNPRLRSGERSAG